MTYTLGYWKIRGLRTPITFVLEYGNISYNEEFYELYQDESGNWSRDAWFKVKPTMPLDFPNLPYFFDPENNLKITQMSAIINYICNKHKILLPKNPVEQARTDMMVGVTGDFRMGFVRMSYGDGDTENYAKNSLPDWLKKFEEFFGKNEYCSGGSLTHCDLNLYEIMDHHRIVFEGCFDNYPNIAAFMKRIDDLEQVKRYRSSDKWFDHPMNNLSAKVK